ncbi:MAG: SPOR domain-containing protein [Pseudorhodobacter sp.]|nr:SPOR domain-containing protein [Pseudorhodobacter sp.]
MLFKVFAVAGLAIMASASAAVWAPAYAQSLPSPKERPPASYQGAQYVDSRGCVFLRAGIGGRVNWVARVNASRQPLCGYPPSLGAPRVAVVADPPAARTAPAAAAPRVASATPRAAAQQRRPAVTVASAAVVAPPAASADPAVSRQSGCPDHAPYGQRMRLTDGRTSLICSSDAGFDPVAVARRIETRPEVNSPRTAPRATSPAAAPVASGGYRCPPSAPVAKRLPLQGGGSTVLCVANGRGLDGATPPLSLGDGSRPGGRIVSSAANNPEVPRGYKPAWKDDRLNPMRGIGTLRGNAEQDQVWTRKIPAKLVADEEARKSGKRIVYVRAASNQSGSIVTSSSNGSASTRATAQKAGGALYVQVGSFGVAANAQTAIAQISRLGLPVARVKQSRKGQALQVILAGPFKEIGQARQALAQTRSAGFGDAFLR